MAHYAVTPLAVTARDTYTYEGPAGLPPGRVVRITLRGTPALGIIRRADAPHPRAATLEDAQVDLPASAIALADWAAGEYLASPGRALGALVDEAVLKHRPDRWAAGPERPGPGFSGQVDLRPSPAELPAGATLRLVPEVAGTNLPDALVYHSRMTPKQRAAVWWEVAAGSTVTVVGTRSAVWLPWRNLHTIIVEHEDELAYKEEQAPRYHARSAAAKLAQERRTRLVLRSVAPSLETWSLTERRAYRKTGSLDPTRVVITEPDPHPDLVGSSLHRQINAGARTLLYVPARLIKEAQLRLAKELGRSVGTFDGSDAAVTAFNAGPTRVLITGHTALHHPFQAGAVGVLSIDGLLQLTDFRAAERAFQLLRKLANLRVPGAPLVIQTDEPEHPAIAGLQAPEDFYQNEYAERRALRLPPVTRLVRIPAGSEEEARAITEKLDAVCEMTVSQTKGGWQVLAKGDPKALRPLLDPEWKVDVDPQIVS